MSDPDIHDALSPPEPGARTGNLPLGLVSVAFLAAVFAGGSLLVARAQQTSYWRLQFGSAAERIEAVRAIADGNAPDAADRLGLLLDDTSPEIRRAALAGLEDVRGESQLWRVVDLVAHDPDPEVREKAVRFCASSRDRTCIPRIAPALDDDVPAVRAEAILALGVLGATKKRARIARFLSDPDERLCTAAVDALGRIGTFEEAMLLAAMLRGDTPVDRSMIRDSLVSITGVDKGIDADAWNKYLLELE